MTKQGDRLKKVSKILRSRTGKNAVKPFTKKWGTEFKKEYKKQFK